MPIRWTSDIHHDSLHLTLAYRNEAENGRMRLAIPLPSLPDSFVADAHFRLAERQRVELRTPESDPERHAGYPGEFEYPTQHFKDFVLVPFGKQTLRVSAHGLHEAELTLIDDVPVLAITLHRAVGELSVGGGRLRRVQAGPQIPTPGAQCLRELSFELHFGFENAPDDRAARRAMQDSHPAWVREMPYLPHVPYGDVVPREASLLEIPHPSVVLSAFKLDEASGDRILRVFNLSSETIRTTIRIATESGTVCETDLRESWNPSTARPFSGHHIPVELGPHKILTLRIRS
jgi:mannosylglycerate hydrolase